MKTKIYIYALFACFLAISSCKKNSNFDQKELAPSNSLYGSVKLESGYLSFKDYQSFISAIKNIYSLKPMERGNAEKSLGFVSIKTIYSNFNKELDALEKLSKEEYFKGFDLLKEKYKKEISFTENSYSLNCSGLAESYLANSDGIVKVGTDFLYLNSSGITTFNNKTYAQVLAEINSVNPKLKNTTNSLNLPRNINGKISYLYGSQPPSNSFVVSISPFKEILGNSGRAKLIARAKIYNINNSSFGNRGFVTYECYATHKNIFGTFRDVKFITGTSGQIILFLLVNTGNASNPGFGYPMVKIDIASGSDNIDEGIKEFVVAASNTLITNHTSLPGILNRVEWATGAAGVDDDIIQSSAGYWYSIQSDKSIPILQAQSAIKAQILGGALLSYPSVEFDPLDMAY
jgi:hypothetical protein